MLMQLKQNLCLALILSLGESQHLMRADCGVILSD